MRAFPPMSGERPWPKKPERRSVTICIAAECEISTDKRKLILCSDSLQSGMAGKADTALKVRTIYRGWHILTAGDDDEINATLALIRREYLRIGRESNDHLIDEEAAIFGLREALAIRRKEKSEEITRGRLSMRYDDFIKTGRSQLGDEEYRNILRKTSSPFRASFLLAGLPLGFPFIVEVNTDGTTSVREHFGVIGAGAYLAQSSLLHRQYSQVLSLGDALYLVYEAKKYAEGEVSVGESTSIFIIDKDSASLVNDEGLKWLNQMFSKHGPRSIDRGLQFPDRGTVELMQPNLPQGISAS